MVAIISFRCHTRANWPKTERAVIINQRLSERIRIFLADKSIQVTNKSLDLNTLCTKMQIPT